jgi:hypothetical protein
MADASAPASVPLPRGKEHRVIGSNEDGEPVSQVEVLEADTITKLDGRHAGQVVIAASHGGVYAGYCAARGRVRGVILNDAGVGLDGAGIGSIRYLEGLGIASATADNDSCRIGDAADMRAHGVISHVNALAAAVGCRPGDTVLECARKMRDAPLTTTPVPDRGESRYVARDVAGLPRVVVMDSLSLVGDEDAGTIIVAASHGALLGAGKDPSLPVDVLAAAFCDAGVGKDRAGVSRLPALDPRGIAAVTASAASARIGDGKSLYEQGVVSFVNETAAKIGVRAGMTVREFVERVTRHAASN